MTDVRSYIEADCDTSRYFVSRKLRKVLSVKK